MEEFYKGLYVTVAGMGLVFMSLGLIMCTIWGMERIFRQKEETPAEAATDLSQAPEEEAVAAAIAVGLLALQEEDRSRERGKWVTIASGNGGTSQWTSAGRQILMNSRHITRGTKVQ